MSIDATEALLEQLGIDPRNKQVRVDVTVRVVPMDTNVPINEVTESYLFDGDRTDRSKADVVANGAKHLYAKASGVKLTRPEEGGR